MRMMARDANWDLPVGTFIGSLDLHRQARYVDVFCELKATQATQEDCTCTSLILCRARMTALTKRIAHVSSSMWSTFGFSPKTFTLKCPGCPAVQGV